MTYFVELFSNITSAMPRASIFKKAIHSTDEQYRVCLGRGKGTGTGTGKGIKFKVPVSAIFAEQLSDLTLQQVNNVTWVLFLTCITGQHAYLTG